MTGGGHHEIVRITSAADPALIELPWQTSLTQWPPDQLVALPRGLSRHVVRFVRIDGVVYAVKETNERIAQREYDLLRALERIGAPSVEPIAIVADRHDATGEQLESALVTRHLQFSLPYRALFSNTLRPDTTNRLLDALVALLVRLHLAGFYWGDVSLSNTLFRRDAGAFAAYLVDAETGALYPQLSDGQRTEDVEIARVNLFGDMLDRRAGGLLHDAIDPETIADDVVRRYETLWYEITRTSRDCRAPTCATTSTSAFVASTSSVSTSRSCSWTRPATCTACARRSSTPGITRVACCA